MELLHFHEARTNSFRNNNSWLIENNVDQRVNLEAKLIFMLYSLFASNNLLALMRIGFYIFKKTKSCFTFTHQIFWHWIWVPKPVDHYQTKSGCSPVVVWEACLVCWFGVTHERIMYRMIKTSGMTEFPICYNQFCLQGFVLQRTSGVTNTLG